MEKIYSVKENQNLIDTNLWAGGDYDNSLNNISCQQDNQKVIISKEWSVVGETSFKIKRGGGTGYNWCRFTYLTNNSKQTITATFKIYSPNAEADIWLTEIYNGSEGPHTSVHIYPSKEVQTISLTFTGTFTNIIAYSLRVNLLQDDTCLFIDDIQFSN